MSYRAFKRLIGETSLERKCRLLFGAGILLLITVSFLIHAMLTESLAYDQAVKACGLLVDPIFAKEHLKYLEVKDAELNRLLQKAKADYLKRRPAGDKHDATADELFKYLETAGDKLDGRLLEQAWSREEASNPDLGKYQYNLLLKDKLDDSYDRELWKEFSRSDEPRNEDRRGPAGERVLLYYGAIRAGKSCMACHQKLTETYGKPKLAENELTAIVRIRMDNEAIITRVHINRAFLISTALVTALVIMAGSWIIVRYVIVKPVKHLKDVSDAISAGELNVRSEIQTGDEFEDLSHAFNRMLRNLVSMQDQWRKVNADLDRKVDELAQANMALYESNRLKSDFLATMSHELRTPLNSILGFSEVLLSSNQLSDKQQRWVRNIQSSGDKLLNLINDILDLAKIEAGKMQVRLEEFSIHDVCDGMLNMFRTMAEKKNIDLRGQIDPGIPALRQDVTKLQQILQNLLSNAIKFTPEGGRVLLKAEADPLNVLLTVSDTGVGIAPEEQELIFEKFRQSGNPLTREHAGTGLGLSIVRELSKLLGGEVALRSELGRGSTFTVRLPLQLSEEPRLEFDLADERIDLSKAQRVDVRLYRGGTPASATTKVEKPTQTQVEVPQPAETEARPETVTPGPDGGEQAGS
jgi:signal transduction histidine kinase